MDVRRLVRGVRVSGEGTSRLALVLLLLLLSMGDGIGNFTAAVVGELRNIDCGRGREVGVPIDAEGRGAASRPFVDRLRCLGEVRVGEEGSYLEELVDIDGEMSDGEADRGFDNGPVGGNNRDLLELLISSGSCDITGFDPADGPLSSPEDFVRPSFPPHRSTSSCTEP